MQYKNVKTVEDLRREIKKATKNVDVKYLRDTIDAFLRRVRSVEKRNGELVFDEHS